MIKNRVLLTGASGFLGQALIEKLANCPDIDLRATTSGEISPAVANNISCYRGFDLAKELNWEPVLNNVDVIIHTAARVHVMDETSADPLAEFRKINVDGTINLATQAAKSKVKRFIYISSIKVNGESTTNKPFHADDMPAPEDAYGVSKQEAEDKLRELAARTGMEVVIIRPPLIYGPGVKGNFQKMIRLLNKGIPLPLGSVKNKRSFVSIDNLMSLIVVCLDHPQAANETFLISDGEDLSIAELLKKIGQLMNKRVYLLPLPHNILKLAALLLRKKTIFQRVCGSLQVDINKNSQLLNWKPQSDNTDTLRNTIKSCR